MKLLMIYATKFAFSPNLKSLEDAPLTCETKEYNNIVVGFVHVEKEDEGRLKSVERSLVNNLKWAARKNETNKILIHSFAHLSDSKADPQITIDFLNKVEKRISQTEYEVSQTPWGYFLNLDIQAPGTSLARIFKSF